MRLLFPILFALSLLRATGATKTLVFLGDSLTYGYGLEDPGTESYPARIGQRIRDQHLPWRVVNAGLSGDTTSGGVGRIDWILREKPDLVVLALGANDGLRGISPAVTEANLRKIIARIRAHDPGTRIVIAGMRLPDLLGPSYVRAYGAVFPRVARDTGAVLIPFLLDGVGGVPELNQADTAHPNAAGAAVIADHLWKTLAPLLGASNLSG